jgi:hypothetical protein
MCGHLPGEKLSLPFDVALSRVVPYEYDGMRLDWEVVETVRATLRATLEAAANVVDSPPHALLTDVWVEPAADLRDVVAVRSRDNLREFQKIVAEHWKRKAPGGHRAQLERLLHTEKYRGETFAVTAIGFYCLSLTDRRSRRGSRTSCVWSSKAIRGGGPALPEAASGPVADSPRAVQLRLGALGGQDHARPDRGGDRVG